MPSAVNKIYYDSRYIAGDLEYQAELWRLELRRLSVCKTTWKD